MRSMHWSSLAPLGAKRFALASLVTLALPLFGHADQIVVKMGTVAPEDTPWAYLAGKIRKKIHKDTNKKVKVKLYLNSVLGDERSLVRQCEAGTIQMIGVSTGALAAAVPELQILELPYLFKSAKQADKILDSMFDEFSKLMEERGFILAYWSENGFRSFGTKEKAITSVEDIAGLNMRAQESDAHVKMYEALGARGKAIAVTEVLSSLQGGQVDGFDNTPLFTFAASWHQGIKHYSLSKHIYQPAVIVYSKKFWDSVPAELREKLVPDRKKLTRWARKLIRSMNGPLVKNLEASGITVHKLSKAVRNAFKAKTEIVYQQIRGVVGERGSQLLDKILAKLGRK